MADSLDKFLRTAKRLYEYIQNEMQGGMGGIDKFLFPIEDMDTAANFSLDRLVADPHGIAFRRPGEQSAVRSYIAGTGTIYEVPRASEKTPISEDLRDSVIAGIESTAGFSSSNVKLLSDIVRQHVVAHNVTRWKLALDTMRTGIFSPKGLQGADIGLSIDFAQDDDNDITYDFTDTGTSISKAIGEMYEQYRSQGGSLANMVLIFGSKWINQFSEDEDVIEFMKANTANVIVEQPMVPQPILNTQGLFKVARYRTGKMAAPAYVLTFNPEGQFTPYRGGTAVDFMPDDEALMFGLDSPRYSVYRGVDVLDGNGRAIRSVGEVVLDQFRDNDPVTEYIRSSTRVAFVPADINKVVRCTGTFPAVS